MCWWRCILEMSPVIIQQRFPTPKESFEEREDTFLHRKFFFSCISSSFRSGGAAVEYGDTPIFE